MTRVIVGRFNLFAVVLLLSGFALPIHVARAGVRSCRTDPLVWLSNDQIVQMSATISADPSDVRLVTYTLHAPAGTSITRVQYTGNPFTNKEQVVFVADLPADHYTTDTIVNTGDLSVPVVATSAVYPLADSVAGLSGSHMPLDFVVEQPVAAPRQQRPPLPTPHQR